ncbi:unnamed protein product (macronuclear) [Paramecium tetraurelia]|uniref:Uncharacterized protein n=1 Tax=Paramecium tetraurelia TaxID=5888 RepID=A0DDS2_PARTE|nr:uncharacterized protein GSPATT00016030001 [Paramecium tetraurelia]CAK81189.1 unnamed protein product [Paramecium tetraurelia]|eukprot:XP_001448586.1 hypothetical protein (macronuclear) [Paramecium tetraurelia strain d4-2]
MINQKQVFKNIQIDQKDCLNNQDIYLFLLLASMKSQNSKKPNLKITLDKKSVALLSKSDRPPSSKCSQKTISSNDKTTASSKKQSFKFQDSFSTPNPSFISEGDKKCKYVEFTIVAVEPHQSQLIQFLIQENLELQKQNSDKDKIITKLLTTNKPNCLQRANTSNTERNMTKYSSTEQKICESKKTNSPLGFTFCNTEQVTDARTIQTQPMTQSNKRLPKEFQIVPNQRRFFI